MGFSQRRLHVSLMSLVEPSAQEREGGGSHCRRAPRGWTQRVRQRAEQSRDRTEARGERRKEAEQRKRQRLHSGVSGTQPFPVENCEYMK